jgi:hypothetical protein
MMLSGVVERRGDGRWEMGDGSRQRTWWKYMRLQYMEKEIVVNVLVLTYAYPDRPCVLHLEVAFGTGGRRLPPRLSTTTH